MTSHHPVKRWRYLELCSGGVFFFATLTLTAYLLSSSNWSFLVAGVLTGAALISFGTFTFSLIRVNTHLTLEAAHASYSAGEQFVSLYERSPVAYLTITSQGEVIRFNPAAVKLLRMTTSTLPRDTFFKRIMEVNKGDAGVLLGKLRSGMVVTDIEVVLQTAEEGSIWVLLSASEEPHTNERLVSLVDITEAKKVDTAKSEFVALATHQLRTPIAAIRWNTELLAKSLKDTATEKQARYVGKIERNIERMIALINDFLNVSKLEMGTFAAELVTLDLTKYLDGVLDEFAEKFEGKHLTLQRQEAQPGLTVTTDTRLFHIIVSNLLSNASKYARDNGTIWLRTAVDGRTLVVTIADDGIGIPAEEVGKLFTKFYRATNAVKEQAEGTGLGLYIVKQAAEQLGGSISVAAEANKGATFVVRLPFK